MSNFNNTALFKSRLYSFLIKAKVFYHNMKMFKCGHLETCRSLSAKPETSSVVPSLVLSSRRKFFSISFPDPPHHSLQCLNVGLTLKDWLHAQLSHPISAQSYNCKNVQIYFSTFDLPSSLIHLTLHLTST